MMRERRTPSRRLVYMLAAFWILLCSAVSLAQVPGAPRLIQRTLAADPGLALRAVALPPVGAEAAYVVTARVEETMPEYTGYWVPMGLAFERQQDGVPRTIAAWARYTMLPPSSLGPRVRAEFVAVDPETLAPLPGGPWAATFTLLGRLETDREVSPDSGQPPQEYLELVTPEWLLYWSLSAPETLPQDPLQPGAAWDTGEPDTLLGLGRVSREPQLEHELVTGHFLEWVDAPEIGGRAARIVETLRAGTAVAEREELDGPLHVNWTVNAIASLEAWVAPGEFPLLWRWRVEAARHGVNDVATDPSLAPYAGTVLKTGIEEKQARRVFGEDLIPRSPVPPAPAAGAPETGAPAEPVEPVQGIRGVPAAGDQSGFLRVPAHAVLRPGQEITDVLDPDPAVPWSDAHRYVFAGREGHEIAIALRSRDFDPVLHVWDIGLSEFNAFDDDSGGGTDSLIRVTLPYTGLYWIFVAAEGGDARGEYTLTLSYPTLRVGSRVQGALGAGSRLDVGYHYDIYRLSGTEGQTVALRLESEDFDPYMELFDAALTASLAWDDDSGEGTASLIRITLPYTGDYFIYASTSRPGESGTYTLSVDEAIAEDGAGTLTEDPSVEPGSQVTGTLGPGSYLDPPGGEAGDSYYYDAYRLAGTEGQTVTLRLQSGDFDAYLEIFDAQGNSLAWDDNSGGATDSLIRLTLPHTGDFWIYVSSAFPGETGDYTLSVEADAAEAAESPGYPVVAPGSRVMGTLGPESAVDQGYYYDLYLLRGTEGEDVGIRLQSGEFDAYLEIFDADAQSIGLDDNSGGGTDSLIRLVLPYTGEYWIYVSTAAVGETGTYTLSVEDHAAGGPPPYPVVRAGDRLEGILGPGSARFEDDKHLDVYLLEGTERQLVTITVHTSGWEPAVWLRTAAGEPVIYRSTLLGASLGLDFTFEDTGHYILEITSTRPNQEGPYTLTVAETRSLLAGDEPDNAGPEADAAETSGAPGEAAGEPPARGEQAGAVAGTAAVGVINLGDVVTGVLGPGNPTLESGEYYHVYYYIGPAGQPVDILLESTDFDAYLALLAGGEEVVAQDDDGGGGRNARIRYTLPRVGVYMVLVTTYAPGETGAYRLTFAPGTE